MKPATLLLALFVLPPACIAQQPAKAPPKDPFVVAAGEISIPDLVDRCAVYLDCNILLSPHELATQNAPSLRLQKAISTDRDGCEEFLASMLHRSGFALTRLDGSGQMLEVISMMGPRGREVGQRAVQRTVEEVLARPDLKMAVSTMVSLQHVNATIASNALRPFFASAGSPQGGGSLTLGNVGTSRAMVLSGMQDQVAQAIRLVRACDVPSPPDETMMPGVPPGRLEQLEQRVKALEEKLAAATKPK